MEQKNNDKIYVNYYEFNEEWKSYYQMYILDCKSKEKKGFINFAFKNDYAWIYKIETDEKYMHQGVGTSLIKALEYFAFKRGLRNIEGKYFPTNEFAKPFYEKNDYLIEREDYDWTIYKFLNKNTIDHEIGEFIENTVIIKEKEKPMEK